MVWIVIVVFFVRTDVHIWRQCTCFFNINENNLQGVFCLSVKFKGNQSIFLICIAFLYIKTILRVKLYPYK